MQRVYEGHSQQRIVFNLLNTSFWVLVSSAYRYDNIHRSTVSLLHCLLAVELKTSQEVKLPRVRGNKPKRLLFRHGWAVKDMRKSKATSEGKQKHHKSGKTHRVSVKNGKLEN